MTKEGDIAQINKIKTRIWAVSNGTNTGIQRTVAEYFAGIGLIRMGLEKAGWRIVFANDISPQKKEMYQTFFSSHEDHYIVDDIFNIDPHQVPLTLLATSSFPCIDLSLAGNRNGIHGKHSSAFWGFIRILEAQGKLSPPMVLVENVPGWLSSNNGADFRITVKALNKLGYFCDAFVLDALHFTPQSRQRVFLVGINRPVLKFDQSMVTTRLPSLATDRLKAAILANLDLNWFSLNIPKPPPLHESGLSEQVIEQLLDIDGRWWPEEKVARHLDMMEPSHRKRVDELANGERWSYRTFYRRIRNNRQRAEVRHEDIAGCLRTAVGGSSRQFILAIGFGQIRMRNMTSREYARLQGVPDKYEISVDENQALTGFGDAVCVPAITWIANNVLNPLTDQLIASVQGSE